VKTSDNEAAYRLLHTYQPERSGDLIAVHFTGNGDIALIGKTLIQNNIDVFLLQPQENNLEQLFINLTTDAA